MGYSVPEESVSDVSDQFSDTLNDRIRGSAEVSNCEGNSSSGGRNSSDDRNNSSDNGSNDNGINDNDDNRRNNSSSSASNRASHSHSHSRSSGSNESMNQGWKVVMASYAALQYASLSMRPIEGTGMCGTIYQGPFVCDLRLLPIKRAIQFLLFQLHVKGKTSLSSCPPSVTLHSNSRKGVNSMTMIVRFLKDMLINTMKLCPELLLPERTQCFQSHIDKNSTEASNILGIKNNQSIEIPQVNLNGNLNYDRIDIQTLLSLISSEHNTSFGGKFAPQYRMVSSILTNSYDRLNISSMSELSRFIKRLLSLALPASPSLPPSPPVPPTEAPSVLFDNSNNKEVKGISNQRDVGVNPSIETEDSIAGLWIIWTTLHNSHPSPQYLELLTLNNLLSSIDYKFTPSTFTSYEQLIEEPLILFRLPLEMLKNLFVLRLVLFITESALSASRCAVRLALDIKHKVAESFLNAHFRDRSVTEAALYLHEQTYLDLQDLMAARLLLGLWDEWCSDDEVNSKRGGSDGHGAMGDDVNGEVRKAERTKEVEQNDEIRKNWNGDGCLVERRLIIISLLTVVTVDNPQVLELLLSRQITPQSFELLLSCNPSLASNMAHCLIHSIQSTTSSLNTLLSPTVLVLDPPISSSSIAYATTASTAASLAIASEISAVDVERMLLHSMCVLKFFNHFEMSIDNGNEIVGEEREAQKKFDTPILLKLAECLVPFLISGSNSLNAHLRPKETKNIELYSAAIISELLTNYPSTVQLLYEFVHSTKRIITCNTAIIALAVKSYDKGTSHAQKVEDERARVRPAIQTLKEIIRNKINEILPSQDNQLNPHHQQHQPALNNQQNLSQPYVNPSPRVNVGNLQEKVTHAQELTKEDTVKCRSISQSQAVGATDTIDNIKDEQGSFLRKKQKLN